MTSQNKEESSFVTEISKRFKRKGQVVAVASAIGDVISEQGGPLIPASYFGVLITSLSDGKEKTEDEIVNLLALLAFVLERVSVGILRAKFSFVSGVLINVFSQCSNSLFILIKLTTCVSLLLQAQDPNTLHQQEAMNGIHFLLSLSSDERNLVSNAAHSSLLSIFRSITPQARKVVSGPVTQYVLKLLGAPAPSEDSMVPVLKLVKRIFRYLPANNVGPLCETILRLPTHGIASITITAFQAIGALVEVDKVPEEDEESKPAELIALQAPQLITLIDTLMDMQPNFNDAAPAMEYAFLMSSLFTELAKLDPDACAQKLPILVEHLVVYFAAENKDVAQTTHDALTTLIENCITKKMIEQAVSSPKASLRNVIEGIEGSLAPKYNRNWDKALLVIAALFDKLGVHSGELLGSTLATVGELYNTLTPQTHMPVFAVLGFAISSMGPQKFLSILPLNLDSPETATGPNPNRSWLIPLLRSNIEQTELKFFGDYILPLTKQVTQFAQKAESMGRLVEAKNKQILHDQLWDLFPSFCELPTDLAQTFKIMAKTVGTLLTDSPNLRKVLYSGLLKLIEKNLEVAALPEPSPEIKVTPEMAKAGIKAMAQFSKNFLPIFFTIYTQRENSERKDALLKLITAYVKISEPQLVAQLFKTLMQKLLEASVEPKDEEQDKQDAMEDEKSAKKSKKPLEKARKAQVDAYSDLAGAFIPSLTITELDFLFRVIKPYFKSKDVRTQKRAYKLLRAMCARDIFIEKFYDTVRELVLNESGECSSAAKKQRIFVLEELIPHMGIHEVTSPALIADIIFCSREINATARKVAIHLLIQMAHRALADENIGLKKFVNYVVAGLAGTTPVMMSGSISALTAIAVEFKDVLDPVFMKDLFSTMVLLLQSAYVEVMTETVQFLKATIHLIDEEDMRPNLKALADGFSYMMQSHKGKFRDYGVHVVAKLIKRYGYDTIVPLFPEECHKVLRAINKKERKKKDKTKKEKEPGEESSSDESDSEFLGENLLGNNVFDKQNEPETFIIEGDEPIDFLDKKAMKRVISAKPQSQQQQKQKKKSEFKTLPDGRLLIQDSDDDEDSHNIYFNNTSEKLPIDDRMMDSLDKELYGKKSHRMTKKRMLEEDRRREDADEDDEQAEREGRRDRPVNEKFRKNTNPKKIAKYAGHQFKAKKAGGDIKIGKLDPFAYIPLDLKNLNKRRRQHAVNSFKPIARSSRQSNK
eukprot:Phypoly_transcript_00558.p1 GENE.Phypoly_transcript_00558~~Phypoly_transcript_00558.p1  ORF type:complete len:1227 (-),score=266.90 Phypoly_transcript_00558:812-4462(-)